MGLTEIIFNFMSSAWILLFIGILTICYKYFTWYFDYWEKQGVKGDKPKILFGTFSDLFENPADVQEMKMYKKYGRVFGCFEGRKPALHVADPDMLKTIFVKDFNSFRNRSLFPVAKQDTLVKNFLSFLIDEEWKQLRNIITPTFTTGKIKQMIFFIEECAQEMIKELQPFAETKKSIDSKLFLSSYTMNVIATCAFGTKFDLKDPNNDFAKYSRKFFNNVSKLNVLPFFFPVLVDYLPPLLPRDSLKFFQKLLLEVIARRKQETSKRKDFLHLLLEAQKTSEHINEANDDGNLSENKRTSKFEMTHEHVISQAILFMVAGFETTAITLSFATYQLIQHEDIQEKLIKEVDEVLQKHNGIICYESVADMNYVEMVISETLRMYPPIVVLDRVCEEDNYNLNGIILKKGMVIGIPSYCMHYDEEFFPNPEVFDPERFSPENRSNINPYTYLPFGYGPRNCLGMRFAMMEIKIALATISHNFRIKKCPETEIPFKRLKTAGFLQPESVKVLLEPRTDKTI